jgi:hypothetical protein
MTILAKPFFALMGGDFMPFPLFAARQWTSLLSLFAWK